MPKQGALSLKGAMILLFLAVLAYGGYQGFVAYLEHQSLLIELNHLAGQDLLQPNPRVQENMVQKIQRYDSQFGMQDLQMQYSTNRDAVTVTFRYRQPLDFPGMQLALPMQGDFAVEKSAQKLQADNVVRAVENANNAGAARVQSAMQEDLQKVVPNNQP